MASPYTIVDFWDVNKVYISVDFLEDQLIISLAGPALCPVGEKV